MNFRLPDGSEKFAFSLSQVWLSVRLPIIHGAQYHPEGKPGSPGKLLR